MNKPQLQSNNAELQAILEAVQSLPAAKSWGGGSIIELSREDVIIPAYTDKELTVKGYGDRIGSAFGYTDIATGSFTPIEEISGTYIQHNLGKKPRIIAVYTTTLVASTYKYYINAVMYAGIGINPSYYNGGAYVRCTTATFDAYSVFAPVTESDTECRLSTIMRAYSGTDVTACYCPGCTYYWIALA